MHYLIPVFEDYILVYMHRGKNWNDNTKILIVIFFSKQIVVFSQFLH